jgi:hypothetical protein
MDTAEMRAAWPGIVAERARLGDLGWARYGGVLEDADVRLSADAMQWLLASDVAEPSSAVVAELTPLEFLDDVRRPAASAVWLRAALDPANGTTARLYVRDHAGRRTRLAGFDNTRAVIVDNGGEDTWGLRYAPLEHLPFLLTRWLPVAAAFAFDVIDRDLSEDELERAVQRSVAADDTGTFGVDALLTRPWQQWMLQFGGGELVEFVTVSEWGTYVVERRKRGLRLHPIPTAEILLGFVEGIIATTDLAAGETAPE